MADVCNCDAGLGNTGKPNCQPIASVTKKLIFVPYFDSTGSINSINLSTATFSQAEIDALVQQSDTFKRWFPTKEIENIEDLRADSIFETLNSGANIKIQDGPRTFTGFLVKESPEYADKIRQNGCVELGAFIVDKSGNLIGNGGTDGELRPIRIDENTWDSGLVKGTDTTVQKVRVKFEWGSLERDEDLRMVTSANIGADLLSIAGLIDADANGAATSVSTTGFTQSIKTCFGDVSDPILVKGLVLADFALYNETTEASVTLSTVTESPDGTYAFTFAAQSSSDVLTLSILETAGYDSTLLEADQITIP